MFHNYLPTIDNVVVIIELLRRQMYLSQLHFLPAITPPPFTTFAQPTHPPSIMCVLIYIVIWCSMDDDVVDIVDNGIQ